MRERFLVNRPQPLDRRVRIRGRLKVRQEVAALAVAQPHPGDALVDLAANAGPRQPAAGAEAAVVAERAAAGGHGAVDIRAGEAGVDADFLHPPPKPLPKMKVAGKVRQPRRPPRQSRSRRLAGPLAVSGLVDANWVGT